MLGQEAILRGIIALLIYPWITILMPERATIKQIGIVLLVALNNLFLKQRKVGMAALEINQLGS